MANLEKYWPRGRQSVRPTMTQAEIDALPAVLDTEMVAELTGTGIRTVQNMARTGRLPHLKVGTSYRFSKVEVCELLGIRCG